MGAIGSGGNTGNDYFGKAHPPFRERAAACRLPFEYCPTEYQLYYFPRSQRGGYRSAAALAQLRPFSSAQRTALCFA